MADLGNSQRIQYKATYVPTKVIADTTRTASTSRTASTTSTQPNMPARVMEKVAFLRSLSIQPYEWDGLSQHSMVQQLTVPSPQTKVEGPKATVTEKTGGHLLDLVKSVVTNISPANTARVAPELAATGPDVLAKVGSALADERSKAGETIRALVDTIRTEYRATAKAPGTFLEAARWAMAEKLPAFERLHQMALERGANPIIAHDADPAIAVNAIAQANGAPSSCTSNLVNGFLDRFTIEPVGRLHLERLEMTPVGIEHGELVHSIPLTPKETVNISHREWSVTSQTFENLVTDSLEGFSEQGVTEKTDLSQSSSTDTKHSSALDVNGSVSASYNGGAYSVTASASVGYKTSSDDAQSQKSSIAHSMAVTRNASSRSRKEHKTSFRVSSVAGTEDMAVRVITNPSDTAAMRVDYFQLIRKWRVDLIRYGLRMTYDVVVPNPGINLSEKVVKLNALSTQLATPFNFGVRLDQITTDSWTDMAQAFGAQVDAPPIDPFEIMLTASLQTSISQFTFAPMEIDIPDGYEVTGGHFFAKVHINDDHYGNGNRAQIGLTGESSSGEFPQKDGTYDRDLTVGSIVGRTGKASLMYSYYNVDSGGVVVSIKASPTASTKKAWQAKVLSQLRDAAQAAYEANSTLLGGQIKKLTDDIAAYDALTLRKMEREEIMKSVLTWLLGPSFQLVPAAVEALAQLDQESGQYELQDPCNEDWQTIMTYGEFIKFIHNAVEWENVIYFAYPYFWDAVENWPFKRFLVHPDPEHRQFLRAGCARVVLTIRPGFESAFSALIDSGAFAALDVNHPYVSIGDEIRNFAMTNYEGIPPANPDHNVRPQLYPLQVRAWKEMQVLMQLLEDYNAGHQPADSVAPYDPNIYPDKLADLAAYATKRGVALQTSDPWGNAYDYKAPGDNGDYDLVCWGASGKAGGPNPLDQPITSWAEGSIVGQWFEYTPTSALDVSINTVLPTKPEAA